MAYDREEIFKQAIRIIRDNSFVFFIEDVIGLLPLSKPTFYDFFPPDSNELNEIKELLFGNKVDQKIKLRKQMKNGKSPEILALYKLIGTDEERKKLSQSYIDHTTKEESINKTALTENQIDKLIEKL